ncbi:hypothetical protein B0H63DRAFT_461580 [Podospora didyma]|uniref:DUF7707 domain-containing protein n=1 Tax=Podospora didyma TaxID=330526 RepID=A0AAE0P7D2_9PEZI|nr:hypothetical protein B0H63DRAFT_461580 [Podospora didyma]
MRQNILLAALSALTVATAQTLNTTVDASTVDGTTKGLWCNAQFETCRTLCANNPATDSCDPPTLVFDCTCQNKSAPGLQYYIQTIPTFMCAEAFARCQAANAQSAIAQAKCKEIDNQCGKLDPAKGKFDAPVSSTSSATAPGTSQTKVADNAAPASSTSKAGAAPTNMAYIGNGMAAVAAGVLAAALL